MWIERQCFVVVIFIFWLLVHLTAPWDADRTPDIPPLNVDMWSKVCHIINHCSTLNLPKNMFSLNPDVHQGGQFLVSGLVSPNIFNKKVLLLDDTDRSLIVPTARRKSTCYLLGIACHGNNLDHVSRTPQHSMRSSG